MPRALSLLAAFASPVFMCAAIAGWLYEVWPANPLTLGVSAFLVVGGPILGIVHVATADTWDDDEAEVQDEAPTAVLAPPPAARPGSPAPAPAPVRVPEPLVLTAKAADARRFASWRDTPNEAIAQRERARRANQYVRG
jgi:hypothetical protein